MTRLLNVRLILTGLVCTQLVIAIKAHAELLPKGAAPALTTPCTKVIPGGDSLGGNAVAGCDGSLSLSAGPLSYNSLDSKGYTGSPGWSFLPEVLFSLPSDPTQKLKLFSVTLGNVYFMPNGLAMDPLITRLRVDISNLRIVSEAGAYIQFVQLTPAAKASGFFGDATHALSKIVDSFGVTQVEYLRGTDGRIESIKTKNHSSDFTYDSRGLLVQSRDFFNIITKYSYDALNRLVKMEKGKSTLTYSYLESTPLITGTNNPTRTYFYNSGKLVSVKNEAISPPKQWSISYSAGKMSVTNPYKYVYHLYFDSQARLIKTSKSALTPGSVGEIIEEESVFSLVNTTNGPLPRLLRETGDFGTFNYTYFPNGLFKSSIDERGNSVAVTYTANGLPASSSSTINGRTLSVNYGYEASRPYLLNRVVNAIGDVYSLAYEAARPLVTALAKNGKTLWTLAYNNQGFPNLLIRLGIFQTKIEYDASGSVTSIEYPDGSKQSFQHDSLKRVVASGTQYFPRNGSATFDFSPDTGALKNASSILPEIGSGSGNTFNFNYGAEHYTVTGTPTESGSLTLDEQLEAIQGTQSTKADLKTVIHHNGSKTEYYTNGIKENE